MSTSHEKKCVVCGRAFPRRSVIAGAVVRNSLAERIQQIQLELLSELGKRK